LFVAVFIIHIKPDDIVVDIFVWVGDRLLRNDCLTTCYSRSTSD
jgi:hypothetical protein